MFREIKKSEKLYDNKTDEVKGFMEIRPKTELSREELFSFVRNEVEKCRKEA